MAFTRIVVHLDVSASFLECGKGTLCFRLRIANVILTLKNKNRCAHGGEVGRRRRALVSGAVFDRIAEQLLVILLNCGFLMFLFGKPVGHTELIDCRGPHIWCATNRHQRHEAAVRAARDTDSFRVYVAGIYEKACGIDSVLQIAAAEILIVRLLKRRSEATRATEIRGDAYLTTRGQ